MPRPPRRKTRRKQSRNGEIKIQRKKNIKLLVNLFYARSFLFHAGKGGRRRKIAQKNAIPSDLFFFCHCVWRCQHHTRNGIVKFSRPTGNALLSVVASTRLIDIVCASIEWIKTAFTTAGWYGASAYKYISDMFIGHGIQSPHHQQDNSQRPTIHTHTYTDDGPHLCCTSGWLFNCLF